MYQHFYIKNQFLQLPRDGFWLQADTKQNKIRPTNFGADPNTSYNRLV